MTRDEITFFKRVASVMVEHGLADDIEGNMVKACRMVLERDEQLWLMVATKTQEGDVIVSELSTAVYKACRA